MHLSAELLVLRRWCALVTKKVEKSSLNGAYKAACRLLQQPRLLYYYILLRLFPPYKPRGQVELTFGKGRKNGHLLVNYTRIIY